MFKNTILLQVLEVFGCCFVSPFFLLLAFSFHFSSVLCLLYCVFIVSCCTCYCFVAVVV